MIITVYNLENKPIKIKQQILIKPLRIINIVIVWRLGVLFFIEPLKNQRQFVHIST